MKLAILSNVNLDFVVRLVGQHHDVCPAEGYGNPLGRLLNPGDSLYTAGADTVFLLPDLDELTAGRGEADAKAEIEALFAGLTQALRPGIQYGVSDVWHRTAALAPTDDFTREHLDACYLQALEALCTAHRNVHRIPLAAALAKGKDPYSDQMWYSGKIPFSLEGNRLAADAVEAALTALNRTPKKVLALDLDNTLWGGIVGEAGPQGITLSEDHAGAAYRDVQRAALAMQRQGVLLVLCSKNNEADALEAIRHNPYMVLQEADFAARRINWAPKADNLRELANELNLGLDSFVFVDDSPTERAAVAAQLPQVTVPDFPDRVELLPGWMAALYDQWFRPARTTDEDRAKTAQYRENHARAELEKTLSYDEFLQSLDIRLTRVDPAGDAARDRLFQMLQKTNQFNLTTHRYTRQELDALLAKGWPVYLYRAADRFGRYGIVAAAIVDTDGPVPVVCDFLMSCRIMGKQIENFILDRIETDLAAAGHTRLEALYRPTAKNAPVAHLYESLGYTPAGTRDDARCYTLTLRDKPPRPYHVTEEDPQ